MIVIPNQAIFLVPPRIIQPTSEGHIYDITSSETLSINCTATAKPDLMAESFIWNKDGIQIHARDPFYIVTSYEAEDTTHYTEQWASILTFNWKHSPLSCSNVKVFNGDYTCRVTDGEREATSEVTTVDVQCRYK